MNLRFILIYGLLSLVVFARILLAPSPTAFPDGTHIATRTRIISTPKEVGNTKQVPVTLDDRKVTLVVSRFSQINYGDLIEVTGSVKTKVLTSGRVVSSIYFPQITVVKNDPWLPFRIAAWVRGRVEAAFSRFLSSDQANLLMGIVFGINQGMDRETKTAFQIDGVMHIIAASGMNVTLLAGLLLPLFGRFLRRQQALILTICVLGFYCLVAGLSASIVRATMMASIGYIGLIVGRQRTALLSVYLTGCIMLVITPSNLSDIGFQLSFAATLGIMLFRPFIPQFKHPIASFFSEDLSSTIAAQLTTLPILLYYFHSVGLLSVVVNGLVLWMIPLLMMIGSLSALVSFVSISLGGLVALLSLPFLVYFFVVIGLFARISPVVNLSDVPVSLMVGYYLMLAALVVVFIKKKNEPKV